MQVWSRVGAVRASLLPLDQLDERRTGGLQSGSWVVLGTVGGVS